MGRQVVDATARAAASPEAVWGLLSDSSSWPDWGIWSARTLEREGTPAPEGVGAIRTLTSGRTTVREEITGYAEPERVSYRLLGGIPTVRNYDATVTLAPDGDGTRIRWHAEFDSILGPLVRRSLQKVFDDVTARLARAAAGG